MKRFYLIFMLFALSAFLLVACGETPEDTTAPATSATTTAAVTTATTAPVTTATPAEAFEYHAFKDDTAIWITRYTGTETHVVIPATIDGLPVRMVGGFYDTPIESVWIPDSVEQIDILAFSDCAALTEVRLGEGLKSIHDMAFRRCTALETITLPSQLLYIYSDAFVDCTALTSITLPGMLENWYRCFTGCTSLRTVIYKDGPGKIYPTFPGTPVREIIIEGDARTLCPDPFVSCLSLESVTFLGDAPTMLNGAPLSSPYWGVQPPTDYTVTIYYPKDAEGWDTFEADDCYTLVPQ